MIMAKLYLIPTTLSTIIDNNCLINHQLQLIKDIKHFIVETPKIARQHLKQLDLNTNITDLILIEYNKHNKQLDQIEILMNQNIDIGILSDCGCPIIADPGNKIVSLAHKNNIEVVPLIGANSIILALMASGINAQQFTFNGYLPINLTDKISKIKEMTQLIKSKNFTQIFIETPYRNQQLLELLISTLEKGIAISVSVNLMNINQKIYSKTVENWKQTNIPSINKNEAIFVIGNY